MHVLLDESMPRPFRRAIHGHDVRTVRQMGWLGLKNGDLLGRATAAGFDVMVTVDRGLEHQQHVARAGIGLVVLIAPSNHIEHLLPLAPLVVAALDTLLPGQVVRIGSRGRGQQSSLSLN